LALDPANVDALAWTVRIDALIAVSDMTDDCAERSVAPTVCARIEGDDVSSSPPSRPTHRAESGAPLVRS
jgi:hypothetical protein